MKMMMMAYNESMEMEVMELLADCGLLNYTKIGRAFGKGEASGAHLGTDVWPGMNSVLYVAFPEENAGRLLDGVRRLRQTLGMEGIKAFVWSLDEVT